MESPVNLAIESKVHARLRVAGVLVIVGLVVEILSLFWVHPIAFMSFLTIGCGFMGLGILIFLWTLVAPGRT